MTDSHTSEETKPSASEKAPADVRQKALEEELKGLVDVVGPGPLVDLLLERAFQLKATDIHLDPTDRGLLVRLRVDGLLHNVLDLPPNVTSHVISRIKLLANMDITERRLAQDGHISNAVLQHQRDIRVGSGPTIHGERLVLRLMPDNQEYVNLAELGFDDDQTRMLERCIEKPYGMILSVGPVGSGKSTTMYSCLNKLSQPTKSLVTIEDPVERRMENVNQIQVDPRIDFGFVEALRGVLRQDPDVMMVGEIRDPETAHIACRAGLTGVVVLSTLHANDTAATIDVFREFGIPPMFIADSLQGIVSQRLLRKVCKECGEEVKVDKNIKQMLQLTDEEADKCNLKKGKGCGSCFGTGYAGRTGVFEIMEMDSEIREAVLHGRSHDQMMALARTKGMETLEESARHKVIAGVTDMQEMHRVLTTFPI
ncbi:MAG: type II/IV secretion system protein [Planctomycetaceae bacterium]|nr:type II/IV secretion system protein [Planctomycetaceae bacterium]